EDQNPISIEMFERLCEAHYADIYYTVCYITKDPLLAQDGVQQAAEYRGAYLIISNRFDLPNEALKVYLKRWRIGVSS
ncbi:MAG: hypothetical protein ACM3YE_07550, partial [Bacteroidota bacterium]